MGKGTRKRGRRGGRGTRGGRKGGGVLLGMRQGFKGIASSVTGEENPRANPWVGRIITVLLLAAAVGLIASRL